MYLVLILSSYPNFKGKKLCLLFFFFFVLFKVRGGQQLNLFLCSVIEINLERFENSSDLAYINTILDDLEVCYEDYFKVRIHQILQVSTNRRRSTYK